MTTPVNRPPVPWTLGDVHFEVRPLPFDKAVDDMAEVYLIGTRVAEMLTLTLGEAGLAKLIADAMSKDEIDTEAIARMIPALLPTLRLLFEQLGGGVLTRLAPRLLASTKAIAPDENGTKQTHELSNPKQRNELFDLHPDTFLPVVIFSAAVTYKRFFPGSVLRGIASDAKKAATS